MINQVESNPKKKQWMQLYSLQTTPYKPNISYIIVTFLEYDIPWSHRIKILKDM